MHARARVASAGRPMVARVLRRFVAVACATLCAAAAAGRLKGGAAKVSVLSSAFFGSISGSASANVASTGAITFTTATTALSDTSSNLAVALNGTTNHSGSITITNANYTAAELATINNGTSGDLTLNTTDTALSGTAANLAAAFTGTVTEHTGTVTITDAPSVTELKTINAATSGDITLDVTNGALSGSAADLVLAFGRRIDSHSSNGC